MPSKPLKILILVLSYNKEPYDALMKAQQETWDIVEHPDVTTVYYYGGGKGWVNEKEFSADASDEYYYMTNKCLETLKETIDWDWQVCFRSNSSSYVSKQKIVEFANALPTEKLFCGWEIEGNAGYNVCSGSGFFISKDVAKILIEKCDPEFCREEDVYISQILFDNGIQILNDKSRIDWPQESNKDLLLAHHIRLKCGGPREDDVENMRRIHKYLTDERSFGE